MKRQGVPTRPRGFTLMEVVIALLIVGFITASLAVLLRTGLESYYRDYKRLSLNASMREFMVYLAKETTQSRDFILLPTAEDLDGTSTVLDSRITTTDSGDCLILVYRDNPADQSLLTRVIILYRVVDDVARNEGAIWQWDSGAISVSSADPVPVLPNLSANLFPGGVRKLIGFIRGSAANVLNTRSCVFLRKDAKSVLFKAEVVSRGEGGKADETVSSSFNFTVSPRG